MKKNIITTLIMLVFGLSTMTAGGSEIRFEFSYTYLNHTLYYKFVSGGVEIVYPNNDWQEGHYGYFSEPSGDVVIPDEVNINGVLFPVISIGASAFKDCHQLESVTIGKNISSIRDRAFASCTSLERVYWNAKNVSYYAYYGYNSHPFYDCSSLNNVFFGDSVQTIPAHSFQYVNITNYIQLLNVKYIGDYAFDLRSNMAGYIDLSNVRSIGCGAFRYCRNLTFNNDFSNVEFIGDSAFFCCTGLSGQLILPQQISSISDYSFYGCTGLSGQLILPQQISLISDYSFYGCSNIIGLDLNNAQVDTIGNSAFENCVRLVTVDLGTKAKSIGPSAFKNCFRLNSLQMVDSVTSIGNSAFEGCVRMPMPKLSKSLKHIGENAFKDCNQFSGALNIPSQVDTIGNHAFSGCSGITSLVMRPQNPPIIYQNTFNSISTNIPVYVPCGRVLYYYVTDYWENFPNLLENQPFEVNISSSNTAMGTAVVTTAPTCSNHQTVITANANNGFHFVRWSDGSVINPRLLYLTKDTTISASFAVNQAYLTIRSSDTIKGTVTGSGLYTYNALAVLTATANSTYHFLRWSDGNTDNPRYLFATQDSSFTAIFVSNASTITVGNFNPEMGTVSGSGLYYYMQQISIMASPNYGYHFYRWNDGNMQNPRPILINCDTSFMAYFAPNIYSVAINTNNSTMGTAIGTGNYHYNMLMSFSATPNYGYHFTQWNDGNINNPRTLTVTKDTSFTAQFAANTYTLTVVANDPLMGGAYGSGTHTYNTQTTISAMPNYGYHFVQWNDGNTENPRTVSVLQNTQYEAQFAVNFYSINVSSNNPAIGSASGGGNYSYNSIINLVATPNYGYHFTQWSDGNTDNPRVITVMQNATYTAQFAINSYAISVGQNNVSMGVVSGSGSYIYNTLSTISATPYYGYHFTQWNDGNTENPRTVLVSQNMAFTAQFDYNTYNLSVVSNNVSAGYTLGNGSYLYNSLVAITAVPAPHYHFDYWSDGFTENPRNVIVTKDTIFTALFSIDKHSVNVISNNPIMGSVNGGGIYDYGTNLSLSATANYGFHFQQWSDGIAQNPRPLIVSTDTTLEAQFDINTYSATILSSDLSMGTVSNSGTYDYLTQLTLSAMPNYGYHFVQWSDGSTDNPRTITLTQDTVITALFSINTYHLNVVSNDTALGSVSGSGDYVYMNQVVISAVAKAHCHFEQWDDGNTSNPRQVTVNNDLSFTAQFVEDEKFTIMVVSGNQEMGNTTGGGQYYAGTQAAISAIPNGHYVFSQWSDGVTENPRYLTVLENALYTALFEPEIYYISAESNNDEMGSVTGEGYYAYGTTVSLQAIANDGYHFVCWNDGDSSRLKSFIAEEDVNYLAFFSEGVGIDEYASIKVSVFPNPTDGLLHIEAEGVQYIDIFDIYGRLILHTGEEKAIDLSNFAAGIYAVRIITKDGVAEKKVVKM